MKNDLPFICIFNQVFFFYFLNCIFECFSCLFLFFIYAYLHFFHLSSISITAPEFFNLFLPGFHFILLAFLNPVSLFLTGLSTIYIFFSAGCNVVFSWQLCIFSYTVPYTCSHYPVTYWLCACICPLDLDLKNVLDSWK